MNATLGLVLILFAVVLAIWEIERIVDSRETGGAGMIIESTMHLPKWCAICKKAVSAVCGHGHCYDCCDCPDSERLQMGPRDRSSEHNDGYR